MFTKRDLTSVLLCCLGCLLLGGRFSPLWLPSSLVIVWFILDKFAGCLSEGDIHHLFVFAL